MINGSFGTVKAIIYQSQLGPPALPELIVVQFNSYKGKSCLPDAACCVAIKPETTEWFVRGKRFSRTQFPLNLAWAITIHKSQGMTLDKVVINLNNAKWTTGLEFVALSRVRRAENYLTFPLGFEAWSRLNTNEGMKLKNAEYLRLQQLFNATKKKYESLRRKRWKSDFQKLNNVLCLFFFFKCFNFKLENFTATKNQS